MKPDDILQLLEHDYQLRQFTVAFHHRLALDNPGREVATGLTENERAMDALGRLLVGDEVCAAVVADGKRLLVSSNLNNHSPARADFLLDKFIFTPNNDNTRFSVVAKFKVSFVLDDDSSRVLPDMREVYFGEYEYRPNEHKLILMNPEQRRCEIPHSEHGIDQYPFPISCSFDLLAEISSKLIEPIEPNRRHDLMAKLDTESCYITRLDPLFRRSAVVFSHLGLLCLLAENKKRNLLPKDFIERTIFAVVVNRRRVMQQTIGWEAAKWYKLDKIKRSYDDNALPTRKQRRERALKRQKITELEQFITILIDDFNAFSSEINEIRVLRELIGDWIIRIKQKIAQGQITIPSIIDASKQYPLNNFLELFAKYLFDLIFLEQHIAERCTKYPDLFTETLARVGLREVRGYNTDALLEIVDAELSNGAHAEMRLFHHLMGKEESEEEKSGAENRTANPMPYFGITQLCCACCNTLFKAHKLNYVQGSLHRAGTHGTHYPNWILDPVLRTERILAPFLGEKLFAYYKALSGKVELNGTKDSRQAWACAIIQDLASLWWYADPSRLVRIAALGFKYGAIVSEGSNYPDFIFRPVPAAVPTKKSRPDYASIADFRRAIEEQYELKVDHIPGDGDCQFRSVARALRFLESEQHQQFISGGDGERRFMFFDDNRREEVAANGVRQDAVQHIRNAVDHFLPFLVEEEGIDFVTVRDFADYMQKTGRYGNNLTLQAIATAYRRPIIVLRPGTSAAPVAVQIVSARHGDVVDIDQAIILIYNGEDHYDVVVHKSSQLLSEAFYELVADSYDDNAVIYSSSPSLAID